MDKKARVGQCKALAFVVHGARAGDVDVAGAGGEISGQSGRNGRGGHSQQPSDGAPCRQGFGGQVGRVRDDILSTACPP